MPVFISYSHNDQDIVEKIASYLVNANIYIWIDKWELNVGDSLVQKIEEAVTNSSVLLIMLSKSSVDSEWCKKEISAGLIRELDEKRVVIIPVLLEDCKIPIFLKDKKYADFRSNFDNAISELQRSLLKYTDISLNRIKVNKYITDWAIDHGLNKDKFYINIDSVSYCSDYEYSVLCVLDITCNSELTELYKKSILTNTENVLIDQVIQTLYKLRKENELKIILDDNRPKHSYFRLKNPQNGFGLDVKIYCRRLGINNGFDILFDFGSVIDMVNSKREEIARKI